ncbi:MAG: hypothetical protein FIB02_06410 [Desulfuromonas sp.]|nr:hypothetical protein [Desulfuromonas sp.]
MKLAEALIQRSDMQKYVKQYKHRLAKCATVQEGLTPVEDPQQLLAKAERAVADLERLVCRISRTNAHTPFGDGLTLADAVVRRDMLMVRHLLHFDLAEAATVDESRYSQREIRTVPTIDVVATRRAGDTLAREFRELDTRIQALNWTVDLIE